MVIVPGLKHKPQSLISQTVSDLHLALAQFSHAVVFAELNLKLNLLWVSIRPIPRIRFEIVGDSGIRAGGETRFPSLMWL